MNKPEYKITPSCARLALWGWSTNHRRLALLSNSLGRQSAMTITANEYRGAQNEKDKGSGYVLVRWAVRGGSE